MTRKLKEDNIAKLKYLMSPRRDINIYTTPVIPLIQPLNQCPFREKGNFLGISNKRSLIQGICYNDIGRNGGANRER